MYDGSRDSWPDLPAEGLICVVFRRPDGRRSFFDGADWYWLEAGEFGYVASGPEWGTWQPEPAVRCRSCLKRGTRLPDDVYRRIVLEAREWRDDDLPADRHVADV